MTDIKIKFDRNWANVGQRFTYEIPKGLEDEANAIVEQNAKIYQQSIISMIMEQSGSWTAKSESWSKRVGDHLFLGEKFDFAGNLEGEKAKRGLRAKAGEKRIFVGARYDVKHHSGFSMEQIAEILQSMPDGSRQLFGPAYERVEAQIMANFRKIGMILRG
jgi:hypothetical protein